MEKNGKGFTVHCVVLTKDAKDRACLLDYYTYHGLGVTVWEYHNRHGVIPKALTSSRQLFTPTQGLKLHIQFGSMAQTVPYLLKVETHKSSISDYQFVTEPVQ
ncbi:hypothetical protein J6590_038281 [Homalodisca vitripennis]|nr:hypothetical protein J6590_038281 [Homalodisca vitripennis]